MSQEDELTEVLKRPGKFVHSDVVYQIIGDHPHSGEMCNPVGESRDTIGTVTQDDKQLYEMRLISCAHGETGVFVAKENLKIISYPPKYLNMK